MATADFKINSSVQADRGYVATTSEAITLTLENAPSADVYAVVYSVEASSKDAPALTLSPVDGVPTTPGGNVTLTMPGSGFHSYLIQCKVNNGKRRGERGEIVDADFTKKRIIAIRSATANVRKTVPGERTEFNENGWSYGLDELAEAFENGAVSGVDTNEPILTDGAAPSLSSARNIQALSSTLAFASTAAVPCTFSRTNAATNTVVDARTLIALSSGTAANGFGVADLYRAAGASGTAIDYGRIGFSCTDITSTSEDTKAVIQVRTGGAALASCIEFTGAGANLLGGAITSCASVSNAGGGLALTAGAGAASLAGSTTATVSAGAGALTLTGATDVNITATTDDIALTAGDAIVIDAAGALTIDAGTTCDLAATTLKASGIATGVSGVVAIAADGTLSRTAAGGASATAAYLIDAASAVNVNDVPIRALAGQLSFARNVAANNVAVDVLDVKATTTDPAFGDVDFGSSLTFSAVSDNNNPVVVARLAATLTDPTDGDEDGKLTIDVISAGSPTSVLTLTGVGDLAATGSVAAGTGGFLGVSLDRATSGTFALGGTNITALTITPDTTVSGTLTKAGTGLTTTVVAGILGENTTSALVGTQVQNGFAVVSKGRIWDGGAASSKTVIGGFYLEGIASTNASYRIRLCVDPGTGTLAGINTYQTNSAPGIGGSAWVSQTFVALSDFGNGYRLITSGGTEYGALKVNSDSTVLEAKRNTSAGRAEVWSNITTGSTDDGVRVWNYAGTRTDGNLIAFGDGGSWTERAAIEYDGIYDGPRLRKTSLKTGNYTAAAWDLVLCDPSGGGFTVTIPAGTTALTGRRIGVKNYGTSTNTITISAASGSIEGGSPTITTAWGYYELECVGTDGWVVVAKVT